MPEYKQLAEGDYGTSKVPGLEIIKYNAPKQNQNGSVRHSFLVKAIGPSRQQVEASRGATDIYAEEPDFDGTAFLSINLQNEWLTPALVAVAMGREQLALASKKVDQKQLDAANTYLIEQATNQASTFGDVTEDAVKEHLEKLKQQIQINVGTIYRLESWGNMPEDETIALQKLEGVQFSGSVVGRDGNNGKRFVDIRVRPKGKK